VVRLNSKESAVVFDVKRFAVHDGPGIRTTVHLKGCPLRCMWCHNPEGWTPEPAVVPWPGRLGDRQVEGTRPCGRRLEVEPLMAEIRRDLPFFEESQGGVTFSGGEPLAWPAFLAEALSACRREGISTCLDTCGFAPAEVWERIVPLADFVLYDLKLLDEEAHRRFTGAGVAPVLANLRRLAELGRAFEIRFPLVPGITDTEENLAAVLDFLKTLPGAKRVAVLPYHQAAIGKYQRLGIPYSLAEVTPPSAARQEEVRTLFSRAGLTARIGG